MLSLLPSIGVNDIQVSADFTIILTEERLSLSLTAHLNELICCKLLHNLITRYNRPTGYVTD